MREAKARRIAREVRKYLTDGRPPGCACLPNPGVHALPCDNRHTGLPRCPLTQDQPVSNDTDSSAVNRG